MKFLGDNILKFSKIAAFCAVLLGLFLQPLAQTLDSFTNSDFEIVQIDKEGEQDGEEKLEKEGKDEKVQLEINATVLSTYPIIQIASCYEKQFTLTDFSLEIPIPPPEVV